MTRAARNILMAATLALPLGGCGSVGPDINFDPLDWISGEWFNTKKPLPGDRKPLFPEGVPGVARGVGENGRGLHLYTAGSAPPASWP